MNKNYNFLILYLYEQQQINQIFLNKRKYNNLW
jgi:hypothetical protein